MIAELSFAIAQAEDAHFKLIAEYLKITLSFVHGDI